MGWPALAGAESPAARPGRAGQHALALLATVLVAGSFLATEQVASATGPMSLTLLRFAGAAVILAPYVLRRAEFRRQAVQLLPRGLLMGFFYSAFFVCFFQSLRSTTTLNTSSLYTLAPFLTALLSLAVLGERMPPRKLVGYGVGLCGTLWVVFGGSFELLRGFAVNPGDLLFAVGVVLMCCFSVSMKALACKRCDPLVLVFCVLAGGTLWMSGALLMLGKPLGWQQIPGDALWHLGYLVLFATIATIFLFQRATASLGPGKVMAYGYLNPGIAALLQFLLHDVPVPAILWPGIMASVAATIVLELD